MERRVAIHENQQITHTDLNNMGEYARSSLDNVVHDGIEHGRKYWGFPVVETGPLEVTVGAGRYYNQGKVFFRDDDGGMVLSLSDFVPLVTRRIVTVAAWGNQVNTAIMPRTFLVDVDTLQTEAEAVATESRRHAEINLVGGTEAVEPQPPALDANVLAIAYITITPGGIESIQMVENNRIASVTANRTRIKTLEAWRGLAGAQIDTLKSDMAGLASRFGGLVRQDALLEVTADVARLKELIDLPVDIASYSADHFLDVSRSDQDHADWLARIEEGIRFPAAQSHLAQILLLNQFEERVRVHPDGLMLPKYSDVARASVLGNDQELSLSQYQYQTIEIRELTRTRERIRYGNTFRRCSNASWWRSGSFDELTGIFTRGDIQYQHVDARGNPIPGGRRGVRLRQIFIDTWEESYTEALTNTESVNGAVVGQSFLVSQDGWLTRIKLFFTRIAETGGVNVLITETTNGAPDLSKVIAKVTVDAGGLRLNPLATDIPIGPVHLAQGRYAVVLVTAGNHFVATVTGNKFMEGSLFYSTDAAWFMGDLVRDLSMELMFAEFESPRVEVQMQPLTLENGIANIDILAEMIAPSGASIAYEIQVSGVWRALSATNPNLLNGLPALLPFRIVLLGTTDAHAGIALGAPSTVLTWRPRTDYKHVSETRTLAAPADTIEVRVQVEWWDDERHEVDCELLIGVGLDTPEEADSVEEIILPNLQDVEDRREFRFRFVPAAPISGYKIRIEGTTDNALVTYHVSERVDIAWNAP